MASVVTRTLTTLCLLIVLAGFTSGCGKSDSGNKPLSNSIGMKLAPIPAGKFEMGAPATEENAQVFEFPQHEVEITKPFYMGIHEVTVGQFRTFIEDSGYRTEAEKDGMGGLGYTGKKNEPLAQKPEFTWLTARECPRL